MKKKSFFALTAAAFAMTGVVIAGAVALVNHGGFAPYLTKATLKENGSYTLLAKDFKNDVGGDIVVGDGITWHYDHALVSGNVVTIDSVLYTSVRSGSTKTDGGRRGNGYTSMSFTDLDISSAVGLVFHETDINGDVKKGGNALASSVDLTFGGTVASENRRGIYFAQGGGSSFSFTSLTLDYACSDVSPSIDITTEPMTLDLEEEATIHTSRSDVFAGDSVSYGWASSNPGVATISGSGDHATVTGVADGSSTITVTMTVNGVNYTDTLLVTVSETPSTIMEMLASDGSTSGAQVFSFLDTTPVSKTAAEVTAFKLSAKVNGIANSVASTQIQGNAGNTIKIYSPLSSADHITEAFSITYTFKDSENHIKYVGEVHFNEGKFDPYIALSAASFQVNEGEDLEITASKASYLGEGTPTFTFTSLNTDVFTVTNEGNVATVRGVEEGSGTLRVTMTLNTKTYTLEKTISVAKPGVQHLIPWYTEGTGNGRKHVDGSGIWTWVKYGDLGYSDFGSFSAKKSQITVSHSATGVRVEVISDDVAADKYCRVYLVLNAAEPNGVLTMTIPDPDGVVYTGTITFVNSEATAYNS